MSWSFCLKSWIQKLLYKISAFLSSFPQETELLKFLCETYNCWSDKIVLSLVFHICNWNYCFLNSIPSNSGVTDNLVYCHCYWPCNSQRFSGCFNLYINTWYYRSNWTKRLQFLILQLSTLTFTSVDLGLKVCVRWIILWVKRKNSKFWY